MRSPQLIVLALLATAARADVIDPESLQGKVMSPNGQYTAGFIGVMAYILGPLGPSTIYIFNDVAFAINSTAN